MAIKPWAATAALCAAVAIWGSGPAFAQVTPARQDTVPASSATRVVSHHRRERGDSGQAMSLVNQVQMLKQQNRQLLGQIEQLQHQLQQIKEINKEQYVALDTRIKRLEKARSTAPAAAASTQSKTEKAPVPASTTPSPAEESSSAQATSTAQSTSTPASASTTLGNSSDAQKAYDAAFDALRAGDFVTSARGFRAFTKQYPHNKLTPNAWYWLGESYYITQNYKQAMKAFEQVIERFPDSRKTPGALLKKGYSQYALKQTDKAQATLKSVIAKYPNSSVAKLAKQRLEDIRLQQQLH